MTTVLALGFDLFFKPRLMSAAESEGVTLVFAKPEDAPTKAANADRVIADASAPGVLDALERVRKLAPDVPLLACYPHVQTEIKARAEGLGARVVTRGAFNAALTDAVAGTL